jgi:hypothetical protein
VRIWEWDSLKIPPQKTLKEENSDYGEENWEPLLPSNQGYHYQLWEKHQVRRTQSSLPEFNHEETSKQLKLRTSQKINILYFSKKFKVLKEKHWEVIAHYKETKATHQLKATQDPKLDLEQGKNKLWGTYLISMSSKTLVEQLVKFDNIFRWGNSTVSMLILWFWLFYYGYLKK